MRLVHKRRFPVDHFILIDEFGAGAPEELIAEARRRAEPLALAATGSRDCFTLIHNGAGLARHESPHVHIVCARSRLQKALIYFFIGAKNLLPTWRVIPTGKRGRAPQSGSPQSNS
ncbi:MAG TPA: hypothetical protein VM074_05980 [Solimonas sp.]|nr:hypothetical protein [Solimonas sp.]